jgi:CDP-glycerol glycerophosphotransferase (TagB/SpsB family)
MLCPNKILNLLLKLTFVLLDIIWWRKDPDLWVIGVPSIDRFDGNVRAIYEQVRQNTDLIAPARLKIILAADRYLDIPAQDRVNWGSMAHFTTLLRAGCILFHHNYNDVGLLSLPVRRINIRVSHGIHFKCVERAQVVPTRLNRAFFATHKTVPHHFVSSKLDAMSAVAYFHIYLPHVEITGAAKNDILLQNNLPQYYQNQQDQMDQVLNGRRLITYAPTWRTNGESYNWSLDEIKLLQIYLAANNTALGIAGHQYLLERHIPQGDAFIDLNAMNIDIQVILRRTDMLISDYSSIWIDYLLLQRPILMFQYDHADYLTDRGILFDTAIFSPQSQCTDFEALMQALQSPPEIDPDFLRSAFHKYSDGQNTQRNLNAVARLIANR